MQERSTASVDAILEATVQVLLQEGKERLTTTKVSARAGVSVGTLYQYFPNKSSLLQAALRRHLTHVAEVVEQVSVEQKAKGLAEMVTALVNAFLDAKLRDARTGVALYSVSSDVDGASVVQEMSDRLNTTVVTMLQSAADPLTKDAELVASVLLGAVAGVSRRLLESGATEKELPRYRQELVELACSYIASSAHSEMSAEDEDVHLRLAVPEGNRAGAAPFRAR